MVKEIWFDMDGTFVNFYGVKNWLDYLMKEETTPYEIATPLFNMSAFARILNKLIRNGYKINIISWTSKGATPEYCERIAKSKIEWLTRHLPSVHFNEIKIVPYGTYKERVANFSKGILFDDEITNRDYWSGTAYNVDNIIGILKGLV